MLTFQAVFLLDLLLSLMTTATYEKKNDPSHMKKGLRTFSKSVAPAQQPRPSRSYLPELTLTIIYQIWLFFSYQCKKSMIKQFILVGNVTKIFALVNMINNDRIAYYVLVFCNYYILFGIMVLISQLSNFAWILKMK
mgnify:CR=1 FL=1